MSRMSRNLSVMICVLLLFSAGVKVSAAAGMGQIISVLADGSQLFDDGRVLFASGASSSSLGLVQIGGSSKAGFGATGNGKLVKWSSAQGPHVVADVSGVKQASGTYWLLKDGSLWRAGQKSASFKGVRLFDESAEMIAFVTENGEIKRYYPSYSEPVELDKISDPEAIVKIEVSGLQSAVLYNDGRIVVYDFYRFRPYSLTTEGADISYSENGSLFIAMKDGTVRINDESSLVSGIDSIRNVIASTESDAFYARKTDGSWVFFRSGEARPLQPQSPESMKVKLAASSLYVGGQVNGTIQLVQAGGKSSELPLNQAAITIDKPHLLKQTSDGTIKSLAVGEASMTVEVGGLQQTVKISSSLKQALTGAQVVNGVAYLPIRSVFQALGGTSSYDAASKSFSIKVGAQSVVLSKGSAAAKVDGRKIMLKGKTFESKGETLFSADLLAAALGAKLTWDGSKQQMTVAVGKGQLVVTAKPYVTYNGMYAVPAAGDMTGYMILKGHPYESSVRIYFKNKNGSLSVQQENIPKMDPKTKVTWTDENGRKMTGTAGDLYKMFGALSNKYTDDWLSAQFGDLYDDWLFPSSVDGSMYVMEYLTGIGEMEPSVSSVPQW